MARALNKVAEKLGPFALALGLLAITVGAVAIVLAAMQPAAYADVDVVNETFNATSDPYTYTVSTASDPNFEGLDDGSVTCYESVAQSTEIACEIQDSDAGKVNVTGQSGTDAGDESIDFTWLDSDTTSYSVIQDGLGAMSDFGGWFGILVIMAVITVIFLFLGVIRRAGRGTAV